MTTPRTTTTPNPRANGAHAKSCRMSERSASMT